MKGAFFNSLMTGAICLLLYGFSTHKLIAQEEEVELKRLPTIDAGAYKAVPYLRAAAKLQSLNKEKAFEILQRLAQEGKNDKQVIVLCRMLFIPKVNGEFRRPRIGRPDLLGETDSKSWPLEPIELVDGIPFLIVTGYRIGGLPEPASSYLSYCIKNCNWNPEKFISKNDKERKKALEKLIVSPKWQAKLCEREKKFLTLQIE
jgi:hypothetical protein